MNPRRRELWIRAILALAIGIAWPYVELRWNCRSGFEESEACVWGKAYLPFSRWVYPLIVGPVLFGGFSLADWLWRTWNPRRPDSPDDRSP